jgi:hypothetical protein
MRIFTLLFVSVFCLVIFNGCGDSTSISGLVPANGKVTLDGAPVGDVNIVFMPMPGSASNRYATAVSKSDGTFQMQTNNSAGVLPGKYSITFSKKTVTPKVTPEEEVRLLEQDKPIPDPDITFIVPEKYEKAVSSGFSAEVDIKGKKDFLFELVK